MRSFTKDFVAMALGMFFGALFAHKLGWFWPIGIVGGGGIGWFVRMLTEPVRVKNAIVKSYKTTVNWRPKEDWRNRLNCALQESVLIGGWFGWLFGIVSILMIFDKSDESLWGTFLKSVFSEALSSVLILYVSAIFIAILILFILFFSVIRYFIFDEIEIEQAISRDEFFYKKMNVLIVHYKVIKYFFLGPLWLICNIPNDASFIRKIFWTIVLFTKRFLILVHHERFTTCGVYAGVGGLIIFFVLPYQILLISIASVICGIVGAILRPSVLSLLEKKIVQQG